MSSIDRLQILGVRSFDNKKGEIIKFFSPLTLIVGHNGSGKTTIIEALRYATTGELPPNSGTGGAWIHDPKLCGENEVLAQVKLSFNSTSTARMVLTRNLQLTVKKTTRSQKALDATLLMVKNGERTTLTSRVAELDSMMPQYLGVSKAILESVIFCHQDESLWPMSTPAVLKKKFDDIFEAVKYTKAVENIKLIRKNQKIELDKLVIKRDNARVDKDRAAKVKLQIEALDAEIEELRERAHELTEKAKDAAARSNNAHATAAQFDSIVVDLRGKRIRAHEANRTIANLKKNMDELSESDEQLQEMLEQYEDRLARFESEMRESRREYQHLQELLDDNRKTLGAKQGELGRYQAQKDKFDEQVATRKELVKETARRHGVRGFDVEITDERVRDFMERIGKMAREQTAKFEEARKKTYEETQNAQLEMSKLNSRISELAQSKASANSYIQVNDGKIARSARALDAMHVDEGGKAVLESNFADAEQNLAKSKQDFEVCQWDSKIQKAESDMRQLDAEKERLDSELMEASRHAKESARLDLVQKDLKERQQSLSTLQGAHRNKINSVLGSAWESSTIEKVYQNVLAEKTSSLDDATSQRDGIGRELDLVTAKLSDVTKSAGQKRSDLAKHAKAVTESFFLDDEDLYSKPEHYPAHLEALEESLRIASQDQSESEARIRFLQESKKYLQDRKQCHLCRRGCDGDEGKKFARVIDQMIIAERKSAEKAKESDVDEYKAGLEAAKASRVQFDSWLRLKDEIPALDGEGRSLQVRIDELNAKLEQHDQTVKEREEAKREVEFVSKTVASISRYQSDITSFEEQIKSLSVAQQSQGSSRGMEKIQEDQKAINDRIRVATAGLQQLRADKERARGEINALELQLRDVRSQLASATYQLKEKESIENQILELKASNSEQRNAMRKADEELQALQPQVSEIQVKLEDIRTRGDEEVQRLQQEVNKLTNSQNQLRIADQEIHAYIDRSGPQQLARVTREISQVEEEIKRIETEDIKQLTTKIKSIEGQVQNHSNTKRAIKDNLTYRENLRDLQTLDQEIAELESHNAEADRDSYEAEGRKWQDERERFSAAAASNAGIMKTKDDVLASLNLQWDTDYKDAAEEHRQLNIKCVVTKAAVADLQLYGGALDKAIMKYHSLKMEEINRIIDELWRNTYQGTDVDTIMIRSENETQKGNKSYNYRVVMVKQDAEMDMRGRCSAGQKVLASIIIRLALAECFGVRCGLIALDEPTTNLDRDNIRALAEALSDIIRVRKQQSNFQLIVITHDEEFLRYMNCADYADWYYRVSRDANQCSQIYRQSIQSVI